MFKGEKGMARQEYPKSENGYTHHMSTGKGGKRHRNRRRKHQRGGNLQLPVIAAAVAVAVILIVVLAVILFGTDGSEETGAAGETKSAEVTESAETESAAEESTVAEETEVQESSVEAASEEETVIAADVGSMEDEEDPQTSTKTNTGEGSGAAVDVSTVEKAPGETADLTLGIDVSKYQGTIDWQKVKEAGVDFAMVRVGYRTKVSGLIYEDPGARYNLQEAQKAGIKTGAYFFSSAVNEQEAKEEASWVNQFISKYSITYPVAYNCEDFQSPDSRQYSLSKEERSSIAAAFLDTVQAAGYTPMFYASRNEMEGNAQWDMDMLGSKYKVWVSQYPDKPYPETAKSSYSGNHDMWQYTSQGEVAGISGKVDVNVAYFGYSQEADPKDPTPAEIVEANPEVGLNFTEVNDTVTAKIETNLRNLPTTDGSEVIAVLKNGDTVQRTGIGSNGFSRVIYQGQKLYAVSSYLTTDMNYQSAGSGEENVSQEAWEGSQNNTQTADGQTNPETAQAQTGEAAGTDDGVGMSFTAVNEAVTAKEVTNLRDIPGTGSDSKVVGQLKYGEAVVRTGINKDTGWSRLTVNGQTVYAVSSYLATDMNYKAQETPTVSNPEAGMNFRAVNDQVTAKEVTNLRNVPTTGAESSVLGELKNGEVLVRTGISDKGWSRLEWNGQTVYAVTNYLTTP